MAKNLPAVNPKPLNPALSTSRFEAITDGVFAIVTTLLFVEVKPFRLAPGNRHQHLDALPAMAPQFLACVTSFLVIMVSWLNHHAMFHLVKVVDRPSLLLNALLLLCLGFVPFGTGMRGGNPTDPLGRTLSCAWGGTPRREKWI